MIKVLPSSNPCPEDKLLGYSKKLMELGVEYLHCDVMDGEFVENSCLNFETLKYVRDNSNILLDVHLMTYNLLDTVKKFLSLKPNIITFHYEALKSEREFFKIVKLLKNKDILVGLAIKPQTPIDVITRLINYVDLILIMSVQPGKSGQMFLESSYEKIKTIKKLIKDKNIIIEVDGGINSDNSQKVISCGAEFLVMGSAFYNAKDKLELLCNIDSHYKK